MMTDDDHIHPLDGERSPLSKSFDEDDEPPAHVDTSFAMPAAAAAAAASASPPPTMYAISSFSLDDDEDDDDADLKRYNLDFSTPNMNANVLGISMHDGSLPASQNLSSDNNSLPKYLWFSFQSLRQKARQRRAQRLLQQSERNYRQTVYLCVMTYCDATDRGILLVASIVMLWSLLIFKMQSHKIIFAMTGISLFLVRVGARPFWEWVTMRRRERRQRIYTSDESNLGDGVINNAATPNAMRLNYSDQPELFMDEPSSSNNTQLELQSMRRANGKANNTTLMEMTTIVPKEADPVIHTV
jgi:hypothetical protein